MLISKKNLIASLSIIIRSHGDEVTDFYDKKFPKLYLSYHNHTCLPVISLDSALKDMTVIIRKFF